MNRANEEKEKSIKIAKLKFALKCKCFSKYSMMIITHIRLLENDLISTDDPSPPVIKDILEDTIILPPCPLPIKLEK